ncbi:hypothetical protein NLJ89_g11974 [Agrocybe chaxingu]|uniref:RRM domain-containing protein n=1 Tax=Agrocybe chaxingu TaxID=84603 RepID=A0A9W8JRF0_9AGAR|nr:hypothetical protein NLJ89_g11974 [Agrocybe chaxingu]
MRIVCPGSTAQIIPGGPSVHPQADKPKRRNGKEREREAKLEQVEQNKKKFDKTRKVKLHIAKHGTTRRKPVVVNHVFVGNLQSHITASDLEKHFQHFGTIQDITIRCSRGQAICSGLALPTAASSENDRQYASIQFKEPKSAIKALSYHGRMLLGCTLAVALSPAEMPEVADIVDKRLKSICERQYHSSSAPKPLVLVKSDTERCLDYAGPSVDRHRINFGWGFSFAKCII